MRKSLSRIYYVRDYAVTAGDGIPTLMRSMFDLGGGVLAHQPAVPLVEGIDGFRVEFGIDSLSGTGGAIDYANPSRTGTTRTRRPRRRIAAMQCRTAISQLLASGSACTLAQLTNTTSVRLYVLARSREPTPGYMDTKTYALGGTTMGPYGDGFKRHVYMSTVRLPNVAGRRETP